MKIAALAIALTLAAPATLFAQGPTISADKPTTSAKAKTSSARKTGTTKKDTAKKEQANAPGAAGAVKPAGNANCPISGAPVGSMQVGSHIVYKGYSVGLCCDGCKGKFNSTPDAYLSKALGR